MNPAHREKPSHEDTDFQAELDELVAYHEEWSRYYIMCSALSLRAKLAPPALEFPAQKPELN
jgi:hypothetical protein